jgi:hypothetical protein
MARLAGVAGDPRVPFLIGDGDGDLHAAGSVATQAALQHPVHAQRRGAPMAAKPAMSTLHFFEKPGCAAAPDVGPCP